MIDPLGNIILNENAYFYYNEKSLRLTERRVKSIFSEAAKDKHGNFLLKIINQQSEIDSRNIKYSICVFKYFTKPSFIEFPLPDWYEAKLAYLIIAQIDEFIIISKKNISSIQEFTKQLLPLDYTVLSTLFVDDSTQIEKFILKNMDISDAAIRQKTLEANNLKENFSIVGAGSYILNNVRLSNENEKVSLSLNTSRINKFGKKNEIEAFLYWTSKVVSKIQGYVLHESFLGVFAMPQDYEAMRSRLVPIAVLVLFSKLYDDFENNHITRSEICFNGVCKQIDLIKYLQKVNKLLKANSDATGNYKIETSIANDIYLKLNAKTITLSSSKLRNILLTKHSGRKQSLLDFLNASNQFIVNFENVELVYTNRKLFKDSRLLGNIQYFLTIFIPHSKLKSVTSEKGIFKPSSREFSKNSIFNFVESSFKNKYDYFLCDDLGNEWADHIGITEESVAFYHSKFQTSQFSASDFQDIVGQAQKNLGNLLPQDYQFDNKKSYWDGRYKNGGVQTNIARLRKGENISNAINQYKKTKNAPNLKREVHLVINFISKSRLEDKLEQLVNAEAFAERNQVIQILWFISSLVSSCKEIGADTYIHCKS